MEHIIQFGVTVDDEAIARQATASAAAHIANEIENILFKSSNTNSYYRSKPEVEKMVTTRVTEWLDEHAENIIDKAVNEMVKSMSRTKIVREKLANAVEGVSNDV